MYGPFGVKNQLNFQTIINNEYFLGVLKGMSGNGSIVWLMFSILQALLAFTGVLPSEMAILQAILGGNSIGFCNGCGIGFYIEN